MFFADDTYTVTKNDTDVAHFNFNAHQPILVIFGKDIAEWVLSTLSNGDLLPISQLMSVHNMKPQIWSFQLCRILCLENDTGFACYIFQHTSTNLDNFCRQ